MDFTKIAEFCWKIPLLVEREYLENQVNLLPARLSGKIPELKQNEFSEKQSGYLKFKTELKDDNLENLGLGFVPVVIDGDIAVMDFDGPFVQRPAITKHTLFDSVSTTEAGEKLKVLGNSSQINHIILNFNSPGGEVAGVETLAQVVRDVGSKKNVVAVVSDFAFSAAFWIASSADKIIMSSSTAQVGSIGVLAVHADFSEANAKRGIKITELTAGKFKTVGSPNRPITEGEKGIIQDRLNAIYTIFVGAVSDGRKMSTEKVLNVADGKLFLAEDAIAAGLADEINSLDNIILSLRSDNFMSGKDNVVSVATATPVAQVETTAKIPENPLMTASWIKENAGDVWDDIFGSGMIEGAKREKERINAIDSQMIDFPGVKEIISEAKQKLGRNSGEVAMEIVKLMQKSPVPKVENNDNIISLLAGESQAVPDSDASQVDKDIAQGVALILGNVEN